MHAGSSSPPLVDNGDGHVYLDSLVVLAPDVAEGELCEKTTRLRLRLLSQLQNNLIVINRSYKHLTTN